MSSDFVAVDEVHVNGRLTLTENLADLVNHVPTEDELKALAHIDVGG